MRKLIYIIIAALPSLSCSKHSAGQAGDNQITVQVQQVEKKEKADLAFRIRVFALHPIGAKALKNINEKMQYEVDSCFYRLNNGKKEWPDGIIPISNGIKDCYEYVLLFAGRPAINTNEQLVYRDRYINGKTYQVILK